MYSTVTMSSQLDEEDINCLLDVPMSSEPDCGNWNCNLGSESELININHDPDFLLSDETCE